MNVGSDGVFGSAAGPDGRVGSAASRTAYDVVLTHIGGPTVLLEVAGWRLLTDPTFDPPGARYGFGWGASSQKSTGPAVSVAEVGLLDAVLLSHDHHGDNLDAAGRALLPTAGTVLTTRPGARRLGGNSRGMAPWETTTLRARGRPDLYVTATPCRHGPRFSRPIAGAVIGFALNWEGGPTGSVWVTGDTVLYDGVRAVAGRLEVDVLLLHLGGVRFPVTGPVRYTMTAAEGIALTRLVRPRVVAPVHYAGWGHFHESERALARAFAGAEDIASAIEWLPRGTPTVL